MTHGEDYTQEVSTLTAGQIVAWAAKRFVGQVAFASALGLEDQAILHLIAAGNLEIPTFTLDTGRLFPQTYDLIARSEYRYGRKIAVTFPDAAQVEQFVAHQGINGFRDGKEQRLACCNVRKIAPLRRALAGKRLGSVVFGEANLVLDPKSKGLPGTRQTVFGRFAPWRIGLMNN
jgi:phosphoadenosine phosphosulfate reductase